MKIGLTVWGFATGVREAVDLAVLAEESGFDSVFMVEGVCSNDALTTVAGMAGRTSRIAIGTGIANVFLRHPVMLALAAAAVDDLSDGRFLLGLGPNNREMVMRAGLPWKDPRETLRETTETVRAVLAGEGLPGLRSPRPAKHLVAIHWAAMAFETCEAAGRHADGLMLYLCTAERYRRAIARMRGGAEAAKRDPAAVAVSLLIPIFVHRDLPTARQAAREFLVHYAGMSHYAKAFAASGFDADMEGVRRSLAAGSRAGAMAALSDRLLDEVLLVGPAARCREQLDAFRKAGVDWVSLGPQRVGDEGLVEQAGVVMRELGPR